MDFIQTFVVGYKIDSLAYSRKQQTFELPCHMRYKIESDKNLREKHVIKRDRMSYSIENRLPI